MADSFEVALSGSYASKVGNPFADAEDTKALSTCLAFSGNAYDRKFTVHPFSRANDSQIATETLYQLKSGKRKGKFLGANVVNYADIGGASQTYIAAEAPYHADDYYRMVLDTDARTLVSLTQDKDSYKKRRFYPVDTHHIKKGKTVTFDADGKVSVTCTGEFAFASPYPDTSLITIKKYKVQKRGAEPYDLHHIIYKEWTDHGNPAKKNDPLALVAAINQSQKVVGPSTVAVNCGYGWGRTNALITMHQIERLMSKNIAEQIPESMPPDIHLEQLKILGESLKQDPKKIHVSSFTGATQVRVMRKEDAHPRLLNEFPSNFMAAEIERFAKAHNLSAANPLQDAAEEAPKKHATDALKSGRGNGFIR